MLESPVEVAAAKGCRTAGLSSELPSCHKRCTPAVEEEEYDVMYSVYGVHLTFKKRTVSNL